MRGKANANFFKQAGGGDMMGGGDIVIAAPKRNPGVDYAAQASQNAAAAAASTNLQGPSNKSVEAAMKRAKQTGVLNLQGRGLPAFP